MSEAHKVYRLSNKFLYNQPILSTAEQLEDVVEYVNSRGSELAVSRDLAANKAIQSLGEGSIAVIPVSGALTYEETWMDALCGMSSYQGMLSMTREAIKQKYDTIVFDHNSGGGQAYGAFETAEEIKKLANDNGIKTIAYVDGMSASAAYALAVACDEIIVNPYAEVGSVGVVSQLRNSSEKDKKEGVSTTYVYAGDSKIPFDADGGFRKDFIEGLQTKIDSLYESFLTHVSEMRGIEKEAVRSTQAKVFSANEALEMNFVDKVMTRSDFANYLADIQESTGDTVSIKQSLNFKTQEDKEKMQLEDMQKTLDATIVEKDEALSQLTDINEKLTELESANANLVAQVEKLEGEKADAVLTSRKEALAEVVSSEKLDGVFEAVKGLDQTAFDTILGSYAAQKATVQATEEFSEVGVEAEADNEVEVDGSLLKMIQESKANKSK